jgi:large subunit ribosomal protein L11
MIIKLLVDGGEMKPGPAVGQKLGPLGINIGDVIAKVNEATKQFKGTKVPAILDIDPKTKEFKIEVSSPPTSELLKKELGLEKGSGDHKKEKVANIAIEQVISIAKTKHPNMLAKDFKSAVKSVIGSCASIGALVENKEALEIQQDIDNNVFDKEITEQKTEVSAEKKSKLKKFFDNLVKEQEAAKKAEEEAAKAEEEAKAKAAEEEAAGAEAPAEGEEKPEEAASTEAEKPAEEAAEEKKE